MRYTTFFLALFSFLTLCSVSSDREISFAERKVFIEEYTSIAVTEMHRTGVPASITLAQFILESNWGRGELFR
jgi:flagellum-specific peptidoglycan hydrolase FlgJ